MTTGIMDEAVALNVPTPDQVPERLDLSQVPQNILRSAVVEALSSQNEDLMARLNVALRRSANLESKIFELEAEADALLQRAETAQDQLLITQEKDKLIVERGSQQEQKIEELQNQLHQLEAQYAELYFTQKERTRQSAKIVENLESHVRRFTKYRRNLKRVAKHFQLLLKNEKLARTKSEEDGRDLKLKLGDAAVHIQMLAKEHTLHQRQLVDGYETQLKEMREEVLNLSKQNSSYEIKAVEFEALYEAKVNLENRLVVESRQFSQYREAKEIELAQATTESANFRAEAKQKTIEIAQLQDHLQSRQSELKTSQAEREKLVDQVESLQLLWHDKELQLEKQSGKVAALQKLNQQLSTTINQQRKELQTLKMNLESQQISTQDKIKEIKGQLQMMGKGTIAFVEDEVASVNILGRIETLIAEIQSGFRAQSPEASKASTTSPSDSDTESSSGDSRGSGATSAP